MSYAPALAPTLGDEKSGDLGTDRHLGQELGLLQDSVPGSNRRREFISLIRNSVIVIGWALITLASSTANAQQYPWSGCVQVTKAEYDSAYNSKYYKNRFGTYVETRVWWRRHYWYCPGSAVSADSPMW
jgi:hypothetical protein